MKRLLICLSLLFSAVLSFAQTTIKVEAEVIAQPVEKGSVQNQKYQKPEVSKAEFESLQSHEFVSETFAGSLPRFIAAFTRQRKQWQTLAINLQKMTKLL